MEMYAYILEDWFVMRLETFSYRFAEEILKNEKYRMVYDELMDICEKCPVAKYPGKSKKQKSKDVVQQVMNTYFKVAFAKAGWEPEPYASPDTQPDTLRSDFRKTFPCGDEALTVQIEVEFGNVASSYRNYFKFQLSFSNSLCDIAVLIVPSCHLSKRIDSGVSNYEKVVRELPSARLTITVPILVIGLFDIAEDDSPIPEWDIEAAGMPLAVAKNVKDKHAAKHLSYVERYYYAVFPPPDVDDGATSCLCLATGISW